MASDADSGQPTVGVSGGRPPLIVGISGSSGALLARRTMEVLGELGVPVHLTYTRACRQVWPDEVGHPLADDLAVWKERFATRVFNPEDFRAPMSSGSFATMGMLVVPCSMRTVSAIANGLSSNLLERAADVVIKEARPLVLMPREAPLSAIHLENMLKLARLGVRIVPPMPQFYLHPQTADEIIDRIVRRTLAVLGLAEALPAELRWRGDEE
ncbi:MAG: Flavin prenyltransferase UbiX [Ktedonobacterales bacterium]|jgi:4-hydroxy-3-polyprenylbenzoate decarboxylase|nr:MAG: Flavin prenyltransferase UbiX [Ktedonobacterales bacterium]